MRRKMSVLVATVEAQQNTHRGRDRATDIQKDSMAAKREVQHPDSKR